MAAVAHFSEDWGAVSQMDDDHFPGLFYALLGLISLPLAILTGGLAIQCYTHAAYGEAVEFFERLQAIPRQIETFTKSWPNESHGQP